MSEMPEGTGWCLGDDGSWHRSETAAAPDQNDQRRVAPIPVPELPLPDRGPATVAPAFPTTIQGMSTDTADESTPGPATPQHPTWTGESDQRPEAGPKYPDLFQQAVAGSALANAVTVNYADGLEHETHDTPSTSSPFDDSHLLVSSSAHTPAEVGAFIGASAKKRWRRGHLGPRSFFPQSATSDRASD